MPNDAIVMAAGIAYIDPSGDVLLLKRSPDSDHAGKWCFPGGHIDEGETAEQAARRESSEEIGRFPYGELEQIAQIVSDEGVDFTMFACSVDAKFNPVLNREHTDYAWVPVSKLPHNTHPGVKAVLTHDCECKACASKRAPTKDSVTAAGFFAGEELGPNQSFTPEGFLICEAVPIARIGTQQYADIELPDLEAGKDGLIVVERNPDVVFAPDTLASLLGKPVTIGHPEGEVTPDNWSILSKGSTFNPRRGEGDQSDLLIADLLIQDKFAINEVRNNGLKGISVGYDADYQQIAPGRARQTTIVANHVALVRNPRCGITCSVQDSTTSLGDPPMAVKNGAESLKDKLRKLFMARDSEAFEKALSEEVEGESAGGIPAIHIHMSTKDAESEEDKKDDDKKEETKDEGPDVASVLTKIDERLTSLEKCVSAMTKDSAEEDKKDDTKDDGEEVDPDMTEDEDAEEKDDDKKPTKDSASFRDEFQDAKARAEILAPGVKLPTFDAKADGKKTADAICVLRRRALRAGLDNSNAELVRAITGDADVSKMDCAAAKMAFHAASELVKRKNMSVARKTTDAAAEAEDINEKHRKFWNQHKA